MTGTGGKQHHVIDLEPLGGDPLEFTIFRPKNIAPTAEMFGAIEGGERAYFKAPKDVVASIHAMDEYTAVESVNMAKKLALAVASTPAKLLRAGATAPLEYTGANILRDQFYAWLFTDNGYRPFVDFAFGMKSAATKDGLYRAMQAAGGFNSSAAEMDLNMAGKIQDTLNATGVVQKGWNVIKTPYEWLRSISQTGEVATRLGEARQARKAGKSDIEAAAAMREVTTDFQRRGAAMKAWNQITAFQGGSIAGLDRLARQFAEKPVETGLKIFHAITLPTVLLYLANMNDPRHKSANRTEDDVYWKLYTDDWVTLTGPNPEREAKSHEPGMYKQNPDGSWAVNQGATFRYPKPHETGIVFGSAFERLLRQAHEQDPRAFNGFASTFLAKFAPLGVPTALLPPLEYWANRDFFYNTPIVPSHAEKGLPMYKYTPNNTELSKAFARMFYNSPLASVAPENIAAPAHVEHFVRAMAGGYGTMFLRATDAALRKAGVLEDKPNPPTWTLKDWPVARGFVVRYPDFHAQPIIDFNDRYKKAEKTMATLDGLVQAGDFREYKHLLRAQSTIQEFRASAGTQATHSVINVLGRTIDRIERNPKMDPDKKREEIDLLYIHAIKSARKALRDLDRLDAQADDLARTPRKNETR